MEQINLLLVLFIFSLLGCQPELEVLNSDRHYFVEESELQPHRLKLTAVGDIMFHHTQLNRGYDHETASFDFSHSFAHVKEYLSASDITLGNLETTLAGPMGALMYVPETHVRQYQAYPTFNSPDVVAENLKEAGFDIALTSNNHTMDSGISGVDRTLTQLHKNGLLPVGTDIDGPAEPLYIQINQMDLFFINWSFGTNGISIPSEHLHRVNSLQNYREERIEMMLQQIANADRSGVDWVVATIHFGPEYITMPHPTLQKELVDRMVDAGADIIIGAHPHVLQPMEIRSRESEEGSEPVFIIYSLGNFLASQPWRTHRPYETDHSIILNLDLQKNPDGSKEISSIEIIPVYTQWTSQEIRVVPVNFALSDQGLEILGRNSDDRSRLPYIRDYVPEFMLTLLPGYTWQQNDDRYTLVSPPQEDEIAEDYFTQEMDR